MINVLHVARMNKGSGVASFLMNYYRYIDKTKVNFMFLSDELWDAENYKDEIEKSGGKLFISGRYTKIFRYIRIISDILRNNHIDIIHCHEATVSLIALFLAVKHHVPIRIAHSHNSSMPSLLKTIIVKVTRPLFHLLATDFYACSMEAGKFLFGNTKVTVINNAVEYEKFSFNEQTRNLIRKQYGFENKFVIGTVGRFNYQKNYPFLISVFAEFNKENPNSLLVVCGDGELRILIENAIQEHHLEDNVILLGNISNVNEVLNSFDCFVLASHYEGLPVVLIEAQVNGLPCLASKSAVPTVCDINNLLTLMNGYSALEWSKKIKTLQRMQIIKKTLVDSGYEISHEANYLESLYTDLINK